jgi:hypothetical protein
VTAAAMQIIELGCRRPAAYSSTTSDNLVKEKVMNSTVPKSSVGTEVLRAEVERISRAWDKALAARDIAGLLSLYALDSVIESPLIPFLLNKAEGICRGWEEMRPFYEKVAEEVANVSEEARPAHGPDPMIVGNKVVWENPRITPNGELSETSSFAEIWELHDGLIRRHHAYWGWDRIAKRVQR